MPVVEGHGELDAVPVLIRRIGFELGGKYVRVNPPYRVRSSSFLLFADEFKKAISICALKAKAEDGIVLILLDCEDDCPAQMGHSIAMEAARVRNDVTYLVCLAYREFETWFMYAAKSLAGYAGLPGDLVPPADPEARRDAKGWFGRQMPSGYKETEHQVSLTSRFDLERASTSRSFRRLLDRLVPFL